MTHSRIAVGLGWIALSALAAAQTQIDLRVQSRNVDFSAAALTKPIRTGVTLPATCGVGELFFKTDAASGQNIYTCSSTNTWTATTSVNATNTGPGGVEVLKAQPGNTITGRQILTGEGLVLAQQTDTVTAETDTAVVPRYVTAPGAPSGACQTGRDFFTRASGFPHLYTCVNEAWKPVWLVTSTPPAVCQVGELLYHTVDNALYACTSPNVWSRLTNSGGVDLTSTGDCFILTSCTPVAANARTTMPSDATAGKFAAVRILIRDRLKLGKGLLFATGGGATAAFAAAIYADNNGTPGAKITDTDLQFVDLAAATYRNNVWGSGTVVLTPNVYWVGFSSEDPVTQFMFPGGLYVTMTTIMGNLSTPAAVKCSSPVPGSGATYLLPSSCGTATAWSAFGADAPIVVASAQ